VSTVGEFRRAYDAYFDSAMHQIDNARREPVQVVLDEPVSEAGRKAIEEVIAFIVLVPHRHPPATGRFQQSAASTHDAGGLSTMNSAAPYPASIGIRNKRRPPSILVTSGRTVTTSAPRAAAIASAAVS